MNHRAYSGFVNDNAKDTASRADRARRHWVADNPGLLARISRDLGVSQAYVSDIFNGRRPANSPRGEMVRRELSAHGAPGFAQTKAA
jgi:hypothetical protein